MKENFYPDLDPVKVICILDFDSTQVAHELANRDEIVVHCNIREQQSQIITSELQSWTFVVLPRFLKLLTSMPTPLDFKGDCLIAWLYFMTREDREQVEITSGIISGTNEIADAYNRLSNLSEDEKKILRNRLEAEISAAISVAGARDEILEEGFEGPSALQHRRVAVHVADARWAVLGRDGPRPPQADDVVGALWGRRVAEGCHILDGSLAVEHHGDEQLLEVVAGNDGAWGCHEGRGTCVRHHVGRLARVVL